MSDLAPLEGLTALQSLDCRGTPVSDLAPLKGPTALQSLYCSRHPSERSRAAEGPDRSAVPRLLEYASERPRSAAGPDGPAIARLLLDASERPRAAEGPDRPAIARLLQHPGERPRAAKGLAALQSLDCSQTQVSDLSPLIGLAELELLTCNEVKLAALPEWFVRRPRSASSISIKRALLAFPSRFSPHGSAKIALPSFVRISSTSRSAEPIVEVKLMVLGNGRVGKTQFVDGWPSYRFQPDSDFTHGVAIVPARLPAGRDRDEIALQMWDFGGQDIYHGTHALFMRDNAIFALIWAKDFERRSEDESDGLIFGNQPLGYWVDYVGTRRADRAVTIVQTRCDRPEDDDISPVPEKVIKEAFGRSALVHFSAATNRGRASLIEKVTESSPICASARAWRRSASHVIGSRRSSRPCAPQTQNCRAARGVIAH